MNNLRSKKIKPRKTVKAKKRVKNNAFHIKVKQFEEEMRIYRELPYT